MMIARGVASLLCVFKYEITKRVEPAGSHNSEEASLHKSPKELSDSNRRINVISPWRSQPTRKTDGT